MTVLLKPYVFLSILAQNAGTSKPGEKSPPEGTSQKDFPGMILTELFSQHLKKLFLREPRKGASHSGDNRIRQHPLLLLEL